MGVREEKCREIWTCKYSYSATHSVSEKDGEKFDLCLRALSQCQEERTELWGQWNAHAGTYWHETRLWVGTKFWNMFQMNVCQYVGKETQKVNGMSNLANVEKASVHSVVFLFLSWLTLRSSWWPWVSFNVIALRSSRSDHPLLCFQLTIVNCVRQSIFSQGTSLHCEHISIKCQFSGSAITIPLQQWTLTML